MIVLQAIFCYKCSSASSGVVIAPLSLPGGEYGYTCIRYKRHMENSAIKRYADVKHVAPLTKARNVPVLCLSASSTDLKHVTPCASLCDPLRSVFLFVSRCVCVCLGAGGPSDTTLAEDVEIIHEARETTQLKCAIACLRAVHSSSSSRPHTQGPNRGQLRPLNVRYRDRIPHVYESTCEAIRGGLRRECDVQEEVMRHCSSWPEFRYDARCAAMAEVL